ncbi:MAG: tryptophan-rich sensory protein [Candidatus Omnitrophica bacterium]|nr:tryptophan-rich sensory protein [Candidatus Omnitrophota bacterium]MDD5737478.1 tryptophan-rich sensory protein [Candidatus Omnitrophota bacterium]
MMKLLVSIAICEAAGIIGSFFTVSSVNTWYKTLAKPDFNPPAWIFAPMWTTLYLMMGVSLFLVWRKGVKSAGVKDALHFFAFQLALTVAWPYGFFGLKCPISGLFIIVILWAAILMTILKFARISRPAAFLLIPYILWVSFATALNGAVFFMNIN